jgi:hypothetical protein
MEVEILTQTIKILKSGREKLIADVKDQRPDIFSWLFRHEKNIHGQNLVFHKYFIEWINTQINEAFSISNELGCFIVKILSPIIEQRASIEKEQLAVIKQIVPQLLAEKVRILENFMNVEDINETRLNQIKFMLERDNALFNRHLENIDGLT